jgi:hypothetical protein
VVVPDHKSTRRSTRRRSGRGIAFTVLSLAVGLVVVSPVATVEARSSEGTVIASAGVPVVPTLRSARVSQNRALKYLKTHQYTKANTALRNLRIKVVKAHRIGMAPLGPIRVLAVLAYEHRVAVSLLPPFNRLTRPGVIHALQTTLSSTFAVRTAMLRRVVALPQEEGPGADYDDGMADALPFYSAEVKQYTAAHSTFRLTAQARAALTKDLARVRATAQLVSRRFGGGE